jgi:hypothetical protein
MPSEIEAYRSWVERARKYIDRCRPLPDELAIVQIVEPPATRREVAKVAAKLPRRLPQVLERWFSEVSAHCNLAYHWCPRNRKLSPLQKRAIFLHSVGGEAKIGPLSELSFMITMAGVWSEGLQPSPSKPNRPKSRRSALELWQQAVPFSTFGDGDMLAIVPNNDGSEPVVYLPHGAPEEAFVLAPTFDEFLRCWELLRYCDQDGLCFFSNGGKSHLNPQSPVADQLREWLPVP